MRLGPISFGSGFTPLRSPLVVVEDSHGRQRTMTLREAKRQGGGGDEPEDPLSKFFKWAWEKLLNL